MTLTTRIRITEPADPRLVFLHGRALAGVPAEWAFDVSHDHWGTRVGSRSGCATALAATWVNHNDGELLVQDEEDLGPAGYVDFAYDTPYGFRDDQGRGCDQLHRDLVARFGAWLTAQGLPWWARDEYSGRWYEATPVPAAGAAA
jgi:hypothetical protein